MGAAIDQPQIHQQRELRRAAHDHHLEQRVVGNSVRRDLHAAAEIGRVGDGNQRDARLDRLAAVDGHADILELVAQHLAHGVEQEHQPARETAAALGRIHRAVGRPGKAEAGDVDEMPAGQRTVVADIVDAAGVDRPLVAAGDARREPVDVGDKADAAGEVANRCRPARWRDRRHARSRSRACSSPSTVSLTVPSPPAAITSSAPSMESWRARSQASPGLARLLDVERAELRASAPARCRASAGASGRRRRRD